MTEIQTFIFTRLEVILKYNSDNQTYTGHIPKTTITFEGNTIDAACKEADRLFVAWQSGED